ncbi:hypothetical protein [Plantactinospora sp. B24E8]|uniref:hypothetical protein n=1 Tax=Plantactinospora sp. B24E8 TaxID=3153567 RepID=UPI00325CC643
MEVLAVLREAIWDARRDLRREVTDPSPSWSSASYSAVRRALEIAGAERVGYAHGMHLFLALTEDPGCRATEVLAGLGVTGDHIRQAVPVRSSIAAEGSPTALGADFLTAAGVLGRPGGGGAAPGRLRHRLSRLVLRSGVGVIVPVLEQEAVRQAVRMGAPEVDSVGLLAAVLSLDEQLRARRRCFAPPWAATNAAGEILAGSGLDVAVTTARATVPPGPESAADRTYRWRSRRGDPVFGADAAAVTPPRWPRCSYPRHG